MEKWREKGGTWRKLAVKDEIAKGRNIEIYKGEKRNVKRCIYWNKNEVNEQFGRKMN